ncbi:Peptidase family M48 protein [Ceratobasidium sp. AG-Ba]|nr:Peptidase family M48 protein [Ceratobasidium sp. AG-Ba]
MSGLLRRRFPLALKTVIVPRPPNPHTQARRKPIPPVSTSSLVTFGGLFAGVRARNVQEGVNHINRKPLPRATQSTSIVGLGTPSLLFHDRRAPRPQQISRLGPIALQVRAALFHASRPAQGLHFVWLATFLKSSTALAFAQTAGRVTMSLLPVLFLKLKWASKYLRKVPPDHPHYAHKREKVLQIRWKLWVVASILVVVPVTLFVSTILASLERTPLTGRMRMIMLSAEEEEEIARELKGAGWYTSVAQILVTASPDGAMPRVIPPDDWRWNWVEQTLRRLESAIPKLQQRTENPSEWYASWMRDHPQARGKQGEVVDGLSAAEWEIHGPVPPPPEYPLIPRPRFAQRLHEIPISPSVDGSNREHTHHHSPHAQLGPPYSLLLVDLPESNALSYGFGGDGGGGIVVYSGFLDEVLGTSNKPLPEPASTAESNSWLGRLIPSGNSNMNIRNEPPQPTPEQTDKLATLLAHELSHLLLSHHLETLSSGTIFIPSVIGIMSDVVRVLLFPITMVLGPFVNDAVANFTRVGLDDVARSGNTCQSRKLEFEADLVSARILACAGFDPRCAIEFWEGRQQTPANGDPAAIDKRVDSNPNPSDSLRTLTPLPTVPGTFWTSRSSALGAATGGHGDDSHPLDYARVLKLKRELARWEREKAYAMGKLKIDSWVRGACEASVKGAKKKLWHQGTSDNTN